MNDRTGGSKGAAVLDDTGGVLQSLHSLAQITEIGLETRARGIGRRNEIDVEDAATVLDKPRGRPFRCLR